MLMDIKLIYSVEAEIIFNCVSMLFIILLSDHLVTKIVSLNHCTYQIQ